jgi:hypothetical protein
MMRDRRRGQVVVEFAFVFSGVIMFIYVFAKVWTWASGTIVQRQEAFQATRLVAGTKDTAGSPVGFTPPLIQLVGNPNAIGGNPPPGPPSPGVPPCAAGQPFFDQAEIILAQARALRAQAAAEQARSAALGKRLSNLWAQVRVECKGSGKRRTCSLVGPFAAIAATQALFDASVLLAQQLTAQALALEAQAQALIDQGFAACP